MRDHSPTSATLTAARRPRRRTVILGVAAAALGLAGVPYAGVGPAGAAPPDPTVTLSPTSGRVGTHISIAGQCPTGPSSAAQISMAPANSDAFFLEQPVELDAGGAFASGLTVPAAAAADNAIDGVYGVLLTCDHGEDDPPKAVALFQVVADPPTTTTTAPKVGPTTAPTTTAPRVTAPLPPSTVPAPVTVRPAFTG
jgi:hypothetical protein